MHWLIRNVIACMSSPACPVQCMFVRCCALLVSLGLSLSCFRSQPHADVVGTPAGRSSPICKGPWVRNEAWLIFTCPLRRPAPWNCHNAKPHTELTTGGWGGWVWDERAGRKAFLTAQSSATLPSATLPSLTSGLHPPSPPAAFPRPPSDGEARSPSICSLGGVWSQTPGPCQH